ncbi:MAG: S8 family serine peptidase, partial [Acidobacteriota bacterium]
MRLRLILLSALLLISPAAASFSDEGPQELEAFQGYLDPAPDGMDVRFAWTQPGGRGERVRICDIESNWNINHNDLAQSIENAFILVRDSNGSQETNIEHGTAVLGELIAAPDGIGVTGIAHRASIGLISPGSDGNPQRIADAIAQAVRRLDRGDVLLVEQQSISGPRFDISTGRGLAPTEFDPAVFNAIRDATRSGIIVIEPAGNGFEDLDHAAYNGAFDRRERDSGAIMVGGGMPPEGIYGPGPDRSRTEESNYGSRVDLQGWSRFVTTCGYGDLRREQGRNNWYTINFGGTSSAAAMIAGAVAVLQSIIKERGLEPLSPAEMRRLLVATGTPQSGDTSKKIGPRPDLRAAIEAIDSLGGPPTPAVTSIRYKKSKGQLTVDGESFVKNDSIIEIDG